METRFQTSFIPKKPITAQESVRVVAPTSIFMIIGVLLFVVSLGAAVLTFFGKDYLDKKRTTLEVELAENERRFNITLIEDLKKANTKIDLANELLKNHVAASEAFNIISALTAEKVRFTSFEFSSTGAGETAGTQTNGVYKIKMRGVADSFNSVAFQANVFSRSEQYGTNKVLKNPVLSDLVVDQNGEVSFNFTADISLADISYVKLVQPGAPTN